MTLTQPEFSPTPTDVDAIVIGAGFSGVYALYELRKLGLTVKGLEAGSDVGGAWYWNRYPGARTDSEAWVYCFSFCPELLAEWDWPDRLPGQRQVQAYLNHVVDRFDLRSSIKFDTPVASASYDEEANAWTVTTGAGDRFTCRYLVAATGPLSAPIEPSFEGLKTFNGEWHLAAHWPADFVDFAGKRVAIVGSGSTGVQILPLAAQTADHVTLFQRTPNYVLPARNHPLDDLHRRAIRASYDKIWKTVEGQVFAFPIDSPGRLYDDVSEDERHRIFEAGWEAGGFRFVFETFDDLFVDERSNRAAAEFIRQKIRTIVRDEKTAASLCPSHVFGAKRPPTGSMYYESFNRPNVSLVDLAAQPDLTIVGDGICIAGEVYKADIIIFATGYDAAVGALSRIDVRGRHGLPLSQHWQGGPRSRLGIMVDGFPNLFMVLGPQGPIGNAPPIAERTVQWIVAAIRELEAGQANAVEATPEGTEAWARYVREMFDMTLFSKEHTVRSWFMRNNGVGQDPIVMFHLGGANTYFNDLKTSVQSGFEGFEFH